MRCGSGLVNLGARHSKEDAMHLYEKDVYAAETLIKGKQA